MTESPAAPRETLLLVDDDPLGREALKRRLERRGFLVDHTGDGSAVAGMLNATRYDLVMLDVEMPGMDGLSVLKLIRASYPVTDLPVIMVTAKDESQDVVQALQLGANDYIIKPLDFSVALARVRTQLSLSKTSHLFGVFRAQLRECLLHFFPDATLNTIDAEAAVRWQERPPNVNYRLGEIAGGTEIALEWLRFRYRLSSSGNPFSQAERRLVKVLIQVLDSRYRAMFDLDMPNRLQLVHYPIEDWVVAEYLWPDNALPVLESLKLLRVAALLTYENRKLSTGILLTADAGSSADETCALPPLGTWLFQVKGLQRLCDGLHTVYVADRRGRMCGAAEIQAWNRSETAALPLPAPCPRAYTAHARATLSHDRVCLVLTPSQEIKVFAWGTLIFAFRGARWHLLDIANKFETWRQSLSDSTEADVVGPIFQAALDLAESRHGALFAVLEAPQQSLAELVAPENRLRQDRGVPDAEAPLMARTLQVTLGGKTVKQIGARLIEALAAIDGALVLDRQGRVLAAGAVLRGGMLEDGHQPVFEGARTTAASAASRFGPVLKVSEDGLVTLFRNGRPSWQL